MKTLARIKYQNETQGKAIHLLVMARIPRNQIEGFI